MQSWLISANQNYYDFVSAFKELKYIDWTKNANYENGDIVYIYCSKPYQRIMYKVEVVKKAVHPEDYIDDKKYWTSLEKYRSSRNSGKDCFRIKLLSYVNNDSLSLDNLLDNGLKSVPLGPRRINHELLNYICKYFNS